MQKLLVVCALFSLSVTACKPESQKQSSSGSKPNTCTSTNTSVYPSGNQVSKSAQNILQQNCISCHSTTGSRPTSDFNNQSIAMGKASQIAQYVAIPLGQQFHMPPTTQLDAGDVSILQQWAMNPSMFTTYFTSTTTSTSTTQNPYIYPCP